MSTGRIGIAAQMLGLAQGAFEKAVPYTYQRTQFGQAVGTFQGMAFQIAQAAVEIESARLLTYNAARRKEEGKTFAKEAAMAKYWASVIAQRVSGQAIEWAGGVGFTRETGIEKFWRDSKIVSGVARHPVIHSVKLALVGTLGGYLRRNVEYSTADNCEIYTKAVLLVIAVVSWESTMSRCLHKEKNALEYCPPNYRTQNLA